MRFPVQFTDSRTIDAALARIDLRLIARPDPDQGGFRQGEPDPRGRCVDLHQMCVTAGSGAVRFSDYVHWRRLAANRMTELLEFNKTGGSFMAYLDIVTALAVLQFIVFGFKVGAARERYGVKAPAITGNETFERLFRIQMNTLEQLIVLLPGLYLFARYFSPYVAAALGVLYLLGRELYAFTYVRDPAKRSVGYGITFLPMVILIVGGLIGAVRALFYT